MQITDQSAPFLIRRSPGHVYRFRNRLSLPGSLQAPSSASNLSLPYLFMVSQTQKQHHCQHLLALNYGSHAGPIQGPFQVSARFCYFSLGPFRVAGRDHQRPSGSLTKEAASRRQHPQSQNIRQVCNRKALASKSASAQPSRKTDVIQSEGFCSTRCMPYFPCSFAFSHAKATHPTRLHPIPYPSSSVCRCLTMPSNLRSCLPALPPGDPLQTTAALHPFPAPRLHFFCEVGSLFHMKANHGISAEFPSYTDASQAWHRAKD